MDIINDAVKHPAHYTDGKIEVIDFIEDKGFDFCLGNAIKYISRAGKKDPNKKIEDLQKAIWYINREISQLSKPKSENTITNKEKAFVNMMFGKASVENDNR